MPIPEGSARTLKPLVPSTNAASVGVIAIAGKQILSEDGEIKPLADVCNVFRDASESFVITNGFHHVFETLDYHFRDSPDWQYRAVCSEMEDDPRISTVVSFFGFSRTSHKKRRRGRYFYPVGIDTFVKDLEAFGPGDDLVKMLRFGIALRDFCAEMQIRPKTTGAGIAGQLLRHPMFYPESRRRVPSFINDVAREHLPGNLYSLFDGAQQNVEAAVYIDQKAAHHYAARTTPLPDANSLYARGHSQEKIVDRHHVWVYDKPWVYPGEDGYDLVRKQHGLLRVRLKIPNTSIPYRHLPPPARFVGEKTIMLWSNELALVEKMGGEVKYIVCAYSSGHRDTGLPKYAAWAETQPGWLKQTLLSAYGVLATRRRRTRFIHARGIGEEVEIPIGPVLIPGKAGGIQKTTHGITNVVQRGLIESYVRVLSLELVREIEERGGDVISIYGDGVFIRAGIGEQLPLALPWREKAEVHNLTFEGPHRLRSDEINRLPGTPRFYREYTPVGLTSAKD